MDNVENNTPLLIGIGTLLLITGALSAYVFMPPQVVEIAPAVTEIITEEEDEKTAFYAWHAPEDYVHIVREYEVVIPLPEPDTLGTVPVETALANRRSVRSFSDQSLTVKDISQMLWAGIGQTTDDGKRTAPSPGSGNPTALFLVAVSVEGLEAGLYEYLEDRHALGLVRRGDHRDSWEAITQQPYPMNAPAVMLVTGDMYKQYQRFGEASERLVLQESGHVGQNLYLQAHALNLGMVVMGAINTIAGQEFLGTPAYEPVVYLVPFGNLAEE